ncbi:MAG: Ldh family oxidoreductase [Parvularculaceae bacterium]
MDKRTITLDEARDLVARAFVVAGAREDNARSTAEAIVAAEADGQKGHGLSRVSSYAAQVRTGKVDGAARPGVERVAAGVVRVDAGHGFAYPAIDAALTAVAPLAREQGLALATIVRSHHFGQAGAHVERLADAGLVGFLFGNSPKGIAFWGSAAPAMGTNPIAFAAPAPPGPDNPYGAPLVIDLSVSVAARGKIMAAKKTGEAIPEGWALDADGQPTTDPEAALAGSMVPVGGPKGAALALMVEIMAAALTGGHFGFEASSLFEGDGEPPNLGQTILAVDPTVIAGDGFAARMGVLMAAIDDAPGARRPGDSRFARRAAAARDGLAVPAPLYDEIVALGADA